MLDDSIQLITMSIYSYMDKILKKYYNKDMDKIRRNKFTLSASSILHW